MLNFDPTQRCTMYEAIYSPVFHSFCDKNTPISDGLTRSVSRASDGNALGYSAKSTRAQSSKSDKINKHNTGNSNNSNNNQNGVKYIPYMHYYNGTCSTEEGSNKGQRYINQV